MRGRGRPGGIVTAKVLLENGFDVTVFDKYQQVGGIWSSEGCYDGLANQSALRLFEFADLPNRLHFAGAVDTQRYLEDYARTFGVLDCVRPRTEVISIRPVEGSGRVGSSGWSVDSRPAGDEAADLHRETFDYVVVASGAHHHAQLPELPGRESFRGTVLHSNEVRAGTFAGRRVVVVGGGKSAVDLVTRAAPEAASATIVQRKVNWMILSGFCSAWSATSGSCSPGSARRSCPAITIPPASPRSTASTSGSSVLCGGSSPATCCFPPGCTGCRGICGPLTRSRSIWPMRE
ncbi:FAD-dependent oxidoreductase [Streptomyces sp. NBC_00887]|uniref:FAD-dependent oxidoreductase n=1 Tax=Streptomyces sp. NBC_00887 TaxID=2975859 RepID=UPI003865E7CE|nr:FAD-dependent oxidoreductase [Streptomyces sp. NBC_00887]